MRELYNVSPATLYNSEGGIQVHPSHIRKWYLRHRVGEWSPITRLGGGRIRGWHHAAGTCRRNYEPLAGREIQKYHKALLNHQEWKVSVGSDKTGEQSA